LSFKRRRKKKEWREEKICPKLNIDNVNADNIKKLSLVIFQTERIDE